jgi:hypothetical protein
MGRKDTLPSEIRISSDQGRQSVLWLGRFGNLEVRKVIQLQTDKLYFTTSVVVKNIGSATLRDFYCKFFTLRVVYTVEVVVCEKMPF